MIVRYSAAHLALPIAAATAAGIPREAYTIYTGSDTAYPDEEAVANLAIRQLDPSTLVLVEAAIPALLARGFRVVRGLNAAGQRGVYDLFYFWDDRPGALIDCQALWRGFRPGVRNVEGRPGVWPWPDDEAGDGGTAK